MSLTPEQVRHVAKLARLRLSDAEVDKFSGQLSAILEYVAILNEVDTEGVEPTSQVTGLQNVTREDVVRKNQRDGGTVTLGTTDELLACSPLPKDRDQIRVKPVF